MRSRRGRAGKEGKIGAVADWWWLWTNGATLDDPPGATVQSTVEELGRAMEREEKGRRGGDGGRARRVDLTAENACLRGGEDLDAISKDLSTAVTLAWWASAGAGSGGELTVPDSGRCTERRALCPCQTDFFLIPCRVEPSMVLPRQFQNHPASKILTFFPNEFSTFRT